MNYQYRYGMSMRQALSTLYAEGGVPRFYRGLGPALFQGPLLRFGDTATNAGVLAFFDGMDMGWCPVWLKTLYNHSAHSEPPHVKNTWNCVFRADVALFDVFWVRVAASACV